MISPRAQLLIQAAKRTEISRANPVLADLPGKFDTWYPNQKQAIEDIVSHFADVDLVIFEGPCGSGKSYVAETVRRIINPNTRTNYICSGIDLQHQFEADFDYAKVLKGRGNYPTQRYPERFGDKWTGLSCEDCNKNSDGTGCSWCDRVDVCPYEQAKREAVRSRLAVANTAYFLSEANSRSKLSLRGARFVVADEADTLDDQILKWANVSVTEARIKKYKLGVPKVTVESDWVRWVDEALPKVLECRRQAGFGATDDVKLIRERNYLAGLSEKLVMLQTDLKADEVKWVYTGTGTTVEFKPVWVDQIAKDALWRHGDKWLLMSATIGSADAMVRTLGWEKEWRFVGLPSVFAAENRQVVCKPVADMSHKANKDGADGWNRIAVSVADLLRLHNNDRILIHSVNYRLTAHIYSYLQSNGISTARPIFTHSTSEGRRLALDSYLKDDTGRACLISPSMDRGIDLPGDRCRVQVIVKVPFPNLGDKVVQARCYGSGKRGKMWYQAQTVRSIVQMCGRAVRSKDDWAVTWILDTNFERLYGQYGHLFPGGRQGWWAKGLRWERT